jgi:hypothetical protein
VRTAAPTGRGHGIHLDTALGEQLLHVPKGSPYRGYERTATMITFGGNPEPGETRPHPRYSTRVTTHHLSLSDLVLD